MAKAVPFSDLIDELAGEGPRDEAFVRALSHWLHGRADRISLALVERLALRDVVVTFKMQRRVRLLITGYLPDDLPGEVTVTVDERDFTDVLVSVSDEPRADPYEFCTLDYSLAGRRVGITDGPRAGATGKLVVSATLSGREEHRVQLDDDGAGVETFGPGVLAFLD